MDRHENRDCRVPGIIRYGVQSRSERRPGRGERVEQCGHHRDGTPNGEAGPHSLWGARELRWSETVNPSERVDTFTVEDIVASLPAMGTFEIRGGKISAWRDYFDMAQITRAWSGEGHGQS
jgi:hypothetical protein